MISIETMVDSTRFLILWLENNLGVFDVKRDFVVNPHPSPIRNSHCWGESKGSLRSACAFPSGFGPLSDQAFLSTVKSRSSTSRVLLFLGQKLFRWRKNGTDLFGKNSKAPSLNPVFPIGTSWTRLEQIFRIGSSTSFILPSRHGPTKNTLSILFYKYKEIREESSKKFK